jgi:hypothetical protein
MVCRIIVAFLLLGVVLMLTLLVKGLTDGLGCLACVAQLRLGQELQGTLIRSLLCFIEWFRFPSALVEGFFLWC